MCVYKKIRERKRWEKESGMEHNRIYKRYKRFHMWDVNCGDGRWRKGRIREIRNQREEVRNAKSKEVGKWKWLNKKVIMLFCSVRLCCCYFFYYYFEWAAV